jgi:hypothetical protein
MDPPPYRRIEVPFGNWRILRVPLRATRSRQLKGPSAKCLLKENAVKALSEIAYRGSRWLLDYTSFISDKPYGIQGGRAILDLGG